MSLPTVQIRLSDLELTLVRAGLDRILAVHAVFVSSGELPSTPLDRVLLRRPNLSGYAPHLLEQYFVTLRVALSRLPKGGGRLRMHHLHLAAAMHCVRIARQLLRHGHVPRGTVERGAEIGKVLKKLEVYRRRAHRRGESTKYNAPTGKEWRALLHFIRRVYLWCWCKERSTTWANIRRRRQAIVNQAVELAVVGLNQHMLKPPPAPILRRLVREALRSIRRGRHSSLRYLLDHPSEGSDALVRYFLKNRAEYFQKRDIGCVLSSRAEQFRNLSHDPLGRR